MQNNTLKNYQKPELVELSTLNTERPGKSGMGQETGMDPNSGPATVS
jgi:hypothetical protein